MRYQVFFRGIAALALLVGFVSPAMAQVAGIYKANDGERWLHVREIDGDVFILGEMQQNYWVCTETGTTPATQSTAPIPSCIDSAASNARLSTFVFYGVRRGSNISGDYYFVPKGGDVGSGEVSFRYATSSRGGQTLAVSGGSLAAATYTKFLNGDATPISEFRDSPSLKYKAYRKLLFPSVEENAFDFDLAGDDLTDIWYRADGTAIYLRQNGDTIAWLAEHNGDGTAHVAIGARNGDFVDVRWAEVPRKNRLLTQGNTRFRIDNSARLSRVDGNLFGDGVLNRRGSQRSVVLTDLSTDTGIRRAPGRPWSPGGHLQMVPTENLYGDRDFDGNGPRIVVDIQLVPRGNRLFANIDFTATEIGGDGSVGHGRWSKVVYTAPPGRTIERVLSAAQQRIEFVSDDGAHGADNWTLSEAYHSESFPAGALVESYGIYGDTRAGDISTDLDPKDDMHIASLSFHPAVVELSPIPDSAVNATGAVAHPSANMSVPTIETGSSGGTVVAQIPRSAETEILPGSGASAPLTPNGQLSRSSSVCSNAVQDKVAWNYEGATRWSTGNIEQLCSGAEDSAEPARCFEHVMHGENGNGGVSYGSGNRWQWGNAANLCAGTMDAGATVTCFRRQISNGAGWQDAIARCKWDVASRR